MKRIKSLALYFLLFSCKAVFSQSVTPENPNHSGWFLVKNEGQWEGEFLYKAQIANGWFYLQNSGYTLLLQDPESAETISELLHHKRLDSVSKLTVKKHALRLEWLNTKPPKNISHKKYSFYHNYFIGKQVEKWRAQVPIAYEVELTEIYPGINWRVYAQNFIPKHDLIVLPGADIKSVQFKIQGSDSTWIGKGGELFVKTSVGIVGESKPVAWQNIRGKKKPILCEYYLDKHTQTISYHIPQYNPKYELIIDPILVFSTYSGSVGDNFGFTATYDSKGNLYAGGIVNGDDGPFPATTGAFQTVYGGSTGGQTPINLACDISISKYSSDGTTLLYATYLGGNRNEHPHSLVVDMNDNLVVFGTTNSENFPVDSLSFDTTHNGNYDIVLTKFTENGTQILGSTYLGGTNSDGINNGVLRFNYADDFRGDVFVDSSNLIYLTTCSRSNNFPTTAFSTQPSKGVGNDAVIVCMDSLLQNIVWSTFLGGNSEDAGYSVKVVDSLVYVAGGTASNNINNYANGAITAYQGGISDGFIASFSKDSGQIKDFSFYGTNNYDQVYFLDYDTKKNIYFTGQTRGLINRTAGTYGQDNTGQFIAKISPDLSTILLETTFGNRTAANKPELSPSAFLVDNCDNIYFSGWGAAIDANPGSTLNLPVSSNAIQSTTDENDFYLIVFSENLQNLLYATYFGGNQTDDHVDGGTSRFDKNGVIYQSVCASCPGQGQTFLSDFPVTNNAAFTSNVSRRCSNAAFKLDFNITYNAQAIFSPDPIEGCSPLTVNFMNNSVGGNSFKWDFGDGNTDTAKNPTHIFKDSGTYLVRLAIADEVSCNGTDTTFRTIRVLTGPEIDFEYEQFPCRLETQFTNLSKSKVDLLWDFGDGMTSSQENPKHKYLSGGVYTVKLRVTNEIGDCTDSLEKELTFPINPNSELLIPNVFTPNNDGLNDCYLIPSLSEECTEGEIIIFNRWGIVVYRGDIVTECWNGKVQNTGPELPDGVYFYILEVLDKEEKRTIKTHGVIHLIRGG